MVKEKDLEMYMEPLVKDKKHPSKILASEVMNKNVISIFSNAKLKDAISLIIEKNINSLPVVNQNNNLLGLLSKTDLIKLLHTNIESLYHIINAYQKDSNLTLSDLMNELSFIKNLEEKEVKDIMKTFVFSAKENSTIENVSKEMYKNRIHQVYIVNNEGVLVGLISSMDLLKVIFE